jgi:hypothetical protein
MWEREKKRRYIHDSLMKLYEDVSSGKLLKYAL